MSDINNYEFLDYEGLRHFKGKIDELLKNNNIFYMGICASKPEDTNKTVKNDLIKDYNLDKTNIISISFGHKVPANSTLNINNTGAKPIYYNNSAISNNIIKGNYEVATFLYQDDKYYLISLNREYTNYSMGHIYLISYTNEGYSQHTCSIPSSVSSEFSLEPGCIFSVYFNVAGVMANSTLKIGNFAAKPIYYQNKSITDNIIKKGDTAIFFYYDDKYYLIGLTTLRTMEGAKSTSAGQSGLVPAPAAGDETKFLRGDGSWAEVESSGIPETINSITLQNQLTTPKIILTNDDGNIVATGQSLDGNGIYKLDNINTINSEFITVDDITINTNLKVNTGIDALKQTLNIQDINATNKIKSNTIEITDTANIVSLVVTGDTVCNGDIEVDVCVKTPQINDEDTDTLKIYGSLEITGDKIYNVKYYGAIGDGEANDTDAIQKAVNLAIANNGTVYFPNGTYKITSTIYCGGNFDKEDPLSEINHLGIKGEAYSRIIANMKANVFDFNANVQYLKVENLYFEATSQTYASKIFKFRGYLWNSAFEHIQANGCGGFIETRLTGNQDVKYNETDTEPIFGADIDDVWFNNITVILNKGEGIDNIINNCCIGFKIGSGSSVWLNNIRVEGQVSDDLDINGYRNTYYNCAAVYLFGDMGGFFVNDCDFIVNNYGLYISQKTYVTTPKRTQILTAVNRELFITSSCFDTCIYGIYNEANVDYLSISNAWIASNKNCGIYMGGSGLGFFESPTPGKLIINGGTIYNNSNSTFQPGTDKAGLTIHGFFDTILVTGVHFNNNGMSFNYLLADNIGRCVLQGCTFSGSSAQYAIWSAFNQENLATSPEGPIYAINCIKKSGLIIAAQPGTLLETAPTLFS